MGSQPMMKLLFSKMDNIIKELKGKIDNHDEKEPFKDDEHLEMDENDGGKLPLKKTFYTRVGRILLLKKSDIRFPLLNNSDGRIRILKKSDERVSLQKKSGDHSLRNADENIFGEFRSLKRTVEK